MNASLDGPRLKVLRAKTHLQAYTAEAGRYFDQKPGEVVPDSESDPQGRVIIKFKQLIPIPAEIPIIIGDALQNLRSALDYLVWELVLAANNEPTDKNMFPVCDSRVAFDGEVRRGRLNGVAPDASALIELLQPYHYGDKRDTAPIRVLNQLNNINKHRRILLTVLAVLGSHTEFVSTVTGHSIQNTLSPRHHNAELAVSPIPAALDEQMEVKGQAMFFITFNEGAAEGVEVSNVCNAVWHLVNGSILPQFERFFS